jgi:hypothetical protein
MVTRWVRPESSSADNRPFPVVQAAVKTETPFDLVKKRCIEAINNGEYEATTLAPQEELFEHLGVLKGSTIDAYLRAMDEQPDNYHADLLLSVLNNKDDATTAKNVLAVAKLDKQIDPGWSFSGKGGTYSYGSAKQVIAGLNMYRWSGFVPPEDLTDKSNPAFSKALGLVTAVMLMWDSGEVEDLVDETICISDGNLVSLILERPEDAEEIAETVHTLRSTDGKRVREAMETASSSLRSGVL